MPESVSTKSILGVYLGAYWALSTESENFDRDGFLLAFNMAKKTSKPGPVSNTNTAGPSNISPEVTSSTIHTLEKSLTAAIESESSLNALADLLRLCPTLSSPPLASQAIFALYRVFSLTTRTPVFSIRSGQSKHRKVVRAWLWEKLQAFVDLLCTYLNDDVKLLRVCALCLLACSGKTYYPTNQTEISTPNHDVPSPRRLSFQRFR